MKVDVLANLETLLHHHEEVNIPGIGTISTRQNDFSIDRRQGVIVPASKHVHHLTQITNPDNETLIHFIAYKHGISLDESRQIVRTFALQYHDIIRHQGLNIPGIGKIFMDETGKMFFEPNSVYNYDVEHFGLPKLQMHPISVPKEEVKEKVTPVKAPEQAKPTDKQKEPIKAKQAVVKRPNRALGQLNPYLNILRDNLQLQALILVSILLILTIPIVRNYISNTSNPASPTTAEIIPPVVDKTVEEPETPTPRTVNPAVEQPKIEAPQPKKEEPTTPPIDANDPNKHIAVVGVFSTKDNAQRYQVEVFNKGFEAILMENGSKFRVGVVLKCSRSELPSKLKELRKAYPKAWLK